MRQIDRIRNPRCSGHGRVPTRPLLCLLAIMGAALAGGCTPWATYPPIEGSTGINDPSMSPIPDVIAQALRYVHFRDGRDGEIIFNLPPGTPPLVYDQVISRLGGGRPMREAGELAYHVTQVRVRTVESEVDVIRRNDAGEPREVTVTVNRNLLSGFFVSDARNWRYPVVEPPPHFMSASAEPAGDWTTEESGDAMPRTDASDEWPGQQ